MARETIKQRIALEGGDLIQEALKALGEAGEKAFEQIRVAAEKAGAAKPLENLSKTIVIIKERLRDLGVAARRVQNNLRAFGQSLNTLGGAFRTVVRNVGLVTAAVGAAAAGFVAFVRAGANAADEIGKQAQAVGLTIREYQRLRFAMAQSGVETEEFGTAMNFFNKILGKTRDELADTADRGFGAFNDSASELGITVRRYGASVEKSASDTDKAASAFVRLGVRVRDADGKLRSTEDILVDVAEAFSKMEDGAEKSALAASLFGARAGSQLIPFLNEGRAGVNALFKEFERLGGELTEGDFLAGQAFGDSLDRISEAASGLRNKLALIFAPALTQAADDFTNVIVENSAAIQAFARDIAAKAIPVMKDLFNALLGHDELVQNPWVIEWRDAIIAFGRGVQEVVTSIIVPAFNALLAVFDQVAAGLNAVLGTEFSGGALLAGAAVLQLLGVFSLLFAAVGTVVSGVKLLISGFGLLGPAIAVASGFFSALVEGAVLFGTMIAGLVGWPALIIAGLVLAGAAIVIFWDDITAAGERATANAREQAGAIAESFQRGWAAIAEGAGPAFDEFTSRSEQVTAEARTQAAQLAQAFAPAWEGIAQGAADAWAGIASGADAAWIDVAATTRAGVDDVGGILGSIGEIAGGAFAGIATAAQFVIDGVAGIFTAGAATIGAIWQGVSDTITGIFTGTSDAIAAAAQAISDAIATATETAGDVEGAAAIAEGLVAPFRDAEAAIVAIWDGITALAQTGFDGILKGADAAVAGIGRVAQQITSKLRSELEALIATLDAAMQRIITSIDRAIARLKRAAAEAKSSGGSGGGDKGLAHGGLILGAGTATSDSIPIWASNNEFMMQARAVRKYGVAFMRLINSGRLSLKALKGMMPGFAQGGLIGGVDLSGLDLNGLLEGLAGALGGNVLQPRLAIAGGGAIAPQRSLRPINLTLPGGETFALLADETVAEKVMRFAVGSELRTAGRKPGWAR